MHPSHVNEHPPAAVALLKHGRRQPKKPARWVIASLHDHQFETVVGPIDFDEKGDLAVQNLVWYVWRGGTYVPLE